MLDARTHEFGVLHAKLKELNVNVLQKQIWSELNINVVVSRVEPIFDGSTRDTIQNSNHYNKFDEYCNKLDLIIFDDLF